MRCLRLTVGCVVVVWISACAARGPAPQTVAALARADQLVVAGCYTCLQEALAVFERELQSRRRAPLGVAQRAFETAVLTALREKELGIPADRTFARARALANQVPATPGAMAPAVLIELAELAPGETSGFDPDLSRITPDARTRLATLRPSLDAPTAPSVLATYLTLSIDCDNFAARQKISAESILARHDNAVTLRYRLALCGLGPRQAFTTIKEADARWVEINFFEGRAAAGSRPPNLRRAKEHFTAAHVALLRSSAILLALAHAQRAYSDLEPALTSYDGVLAMVPTVRNALLGRVITLTYLKRHADAVDTATRMIDLGTWLLSDAYYWRAWNRYALKQLEDAWADAEAAIKLSANTSVYTLAGVIAYDRKQLDTARDLFLRATEIDQANCDAHSYLGLVHVAQNAWPAATPIFSTAMSCFVQAAAQARRELEELEGPSDDPVYTGRLAADRRKTIEDSERKAAEAAYNAAQGYLRAGKRDEALTHLQLALDYPGLRPQAEALRKLIGG